jgi:uncharacterized membrane protein YphA (DoxX/SURF4 family)
MGLANTLIDCATAPYAALLLRLRLGIMFIAHGLLEGAFTIRPPLARKAARSE